MITEVMNMESIERVAAAVEYRRPDRIPIHDDFWSETLEKEIRRRIAAFRDGGWIYHSDHSIPPTMDYDLFHRMMDILREGG
jgi:hypothetical protein